MLYNIPINLPFLVISYLAPTVQETQWETWVTSLGPEGPLEEGMAIPSSILAWRIPWTEEPGTLQSTESQRESDRTEAT